jgi:hypothetical protein
MRGDRSSPRYGANRDNRNADIPPAITTPDTVETRLGTLHFLDGFPDDATIAKVYDNLDFERGVQTIKYMPS